MIELGKIQISKTECICLQLFNNNLSNEMKHKGIKIDLYVTE